MQRQEIAELAFYPEDRGSLRPTAEQILRLFSLVERHTVLADHQVLQVVEPEITPLQKQVLRLLGIPARVYPCPDADQ